MKHIVIIGSGLGALGLAVRMAARRWRVTVCEQGENLGGKLNRWQEQGYTFDTGPSLITMPWVFEETFAAAGARLAEYVQFQRLDPIAHYVYPDGTRFDWSSRLPSILETLKQLEPRDIDGFMRLLELGAKLYEVSNETFLRRATSEPPDWRTLKALRHMPLRHGWGNYDKTVRAHLRSPHLIQLFNRYPTYVGSSPYHCPATLLVIPYIEYAFGGHYAPGGLYRIAEGLVHVGRGLGVEYRTGARVEGIERHRGAVSAVRLGGGERIACDLACMNGDASHLDLLLKVPDAREASPAERSLSGLLLLRGLKRDKPGLAHHTVYFSHSYDREFRALFDDRRFPEDPTVYVNAPSRSDRSLVPGHGETLFIMANAAADGAGSRHNYTVIGQTGVTYDNNRNVLADGTREFRYSYNNQLRRVWRKSDGQGASNGLLAKYREDAFGRRVYAESYWELSRRDVMDTRFSVDVNVDADGDGNAITYLNGGITSTVAAPPGQTDQRAQWDSRIRRPITITNESHYFDFDVTVPNVGIDDYLGFVAYDRFELRIFSSYYELWDMAGPTLMGTSPASTQGRHNIGIRAGQGWGVWVDGAPLTWLGGSGSIGLIANPQAKFGTHPNANGSAITLWENLCYLKSHSRASAETIPAPGVPVVDVLKFDGPRPCVIEEVFVNSLIVPKVIDKEDGTSCDVMEDGGFVETQLKPNGREHVADVIQPSQDAATYDSTGNRSTLEEPQPGSAMKIHVDAVGATSNATRLSTTAPIEMPCWGSGTLSFEWGGFDNLHGIAIGLGGRRKHETFPPPRHPTSTPVDPEECDNVDSENTGDGAIEGSADNCLCQGSNPSRTSSSHTVSDTSTGHRVDLINGNGTDAKTDTKLTKEEFDDLFGKVVGWVKGVYVPLNRGGVGVGTWSDRDLAQVRQMIREVKADLFKTAPGTETYQQLRAELADLMWLYEAKGGEKQLPFDGIDSGTYVPTAEELAHWKAVGDQYFEWMDLWALFIDSGVEHCQLTFGAISIAKIVQSVMSIVRGLTNPMPSRVGTRSNPTYNRFPRSGSGVTTPSPTAEKPVGKTQAQGGSSATPQGSGATASPQGTGPAAQNGKPTIVAPTGSGNPKPSPNFVPPTNPPQLPPTSIPPGWRIRQMPPTAQYPHGYWKLEKPMSNGGWQPIDPSTMKPGGRPQTHVPNPPPPPPPPPPQTGG